jgi:hypothetical protein
VRDFFAGLKRLFEQRPRSPTEPIAEPTADRPPPPVAERPTAVESTSARQPTPASESPPAIEPPPMIEPPPAMESLPVIPTPPREPPPIDVDELAEVRAALEAVSETPAPASTPTPPPAPLVEAVDVPAPIVERPSPPASPAQVGDALVLTLATPPVTFTVAKTAATLGRGQENTIRLDDLSVSRRHARIAYRQGGYWLSDLGSMGGTWVEGVRLSAPRRLAAGEVIDIGLCRLTVGFAGVAATNDTKKSETKGSASKSRSEVAGQVRRRR